MLVAFLLGTRTRCVLSTDYPAGGTLRVYCDYHRTGPHYGMAAGLRYCVSADGRVHRGWLTTDSSIDVNSGFDLSHEVLDGETIKVTEAGTSSWLIKSDGTAQEVQRGRVP